MRNITIGLFCPGEEDAIAALVQSALRQTNSKHYPPDEIEALCGGYTARLVRQKAGDGLLFVVRQNGVPVGCAALSAHTDDPTALWASSVFVLPALQKTGLGHALMARLEQQARAQKAACVQLAASITAEAFYLRLGYEYLGGTRTLLPEKVIPMIKYVCGQTGK